MLNLKSMFVAVAMAAQCNASKFFIHKPLNFQYYNSYWLRLSCERLRDSDSGRARVFHTKGPKDVNSDTFAI